MKEFHGEVFSKEVFEKMFENDFYCDFKGKKISQLIFMVLNTHHYPKSNLNQIKSFSTMSHNN